MTPTNRRELTGEPLDAIAWRFLGSEYAGPAHGEWSIDRRIDAYLRHHGPSELLSDGSAYDALLQRIMSNIGAAQRMGVLQTSNG